MAMASPSWLAGAFAAVMIAIAAYCVLRLIASRRWRRPTELDADGVHVVMGVAMAGMLVTGLGSLPAGVWKAVFGASAAWFAWQAVRARRGAPAGPWRCPYPVPHLVESIAMLYAFLALRAAAHGGAGSGTAISGMGGTAGAARFPVLALLMALFMLGYVVWTADRLTALVPATAGVTPQGTTRDPGTPASAAAQAAAPASTADAAPAGACQPMLAPRLAACYKIAMGIGMGYMLILAL